MINRDGSESNGYFGSSNHTEDLDIEDNGHIADRLAWDLGVGTYIHHRVTSNIKTIYRRIRRWYLSS